MKKRRTAATLLALTAMVAGTVLAHNTVELTATNSPNSNGKNTHSR